MTNPKDSSFPFNQVTKMYKGQVHDWDNHLGLTKREYFAAMAMQGIISSPKDFYIENESRSSTSENADNKAKLAVFFADALITALNKKQ